MNPLVGYMRQMIDSYQNIAYCRPPPPCGPKVVLRPIWEEARDIMKKYNIIEIPPIQTNLNANAPEWKPSLPPGLPIPTTVPLYIKIYEIFEYLKYPEYINMFKIMDVLNIPYSDTNNFINYLNSCSYFHEVSFYNINVKIKTKRPYKTLWVSK
jgi:hypothetical protein